MMQAKATAPSSAVFVLEIDGQPILAFRAATLRKARELSKVSWLKEDLKRMATGHRPLWDGRAPIRVRRAQPAEEVYWIEAKVRTRRVICLWSIWFSATTQRKQLVPALVGH